MFKQKRRKIILILISFAILLIFLCVKYSTLVYSIAVTIFAVYGVLIWFLATMFFYLINAIIMLFVPNPPVPEIQYGKFPVEIVYRVNDEVFEKNDVLIFEYNTYSDYEQIQKTWNWSTTSTTGKFNTLCEIQGEEIYIDCGNSDYYMMNEKPYEDYVPGQYIYYYGDSGKIKLSLEEAKEQLGIEIISAKFSDPIENEFEYRTVDKIRMFLTGGGED